MASLAIATGISPRELMASPPVVLTAMFHQLRDRNREDRRRGR